MRSLKDSIHGVIDLGVVLMIGVVFAGLMVLAYLIWTLNKSFQVTYVAANSAGKMNAAMGTMNNTTGGFDDAINLILVAITIFILAIAISALLMLRGR